MIYRKLWYDLIEWLEKQKEPAINRYDLILLMKVKGLDVLRNEHLGGVNNERKEKNSQKNT